MAAINTRIVRRTNALSNFCLWSRLSLRRSHRQSETQPVICDRWRRRRGQRRCLWLDRVTRCVAWLKNGCRHQAKARAGGRAIAAFRDSADRQKPAAPVGEVRRAECIVKGNHDPGYGETSRMLSKPRAVSGRRSAADAGWCADAGACHGQSSSRSAAPGWNDLGRARSVVRQRGRRSVAFARSTGAGSKGAKKHLPVRPLSVHHRGSFDAGRLRRHFALWPQLAAA